MTAFAIVLGIATVSGTYVLTDSISHAFNTIFSSIYQGTDASITGKSAVSVDATATCRPSTSRCSPKVKALPGVARGARRRRRRLAQPDRQNGKVISFGGAPHLGFSIDPTQARFNSLVARRRQLAEGRRGRDRPLHGQEEEHPRRRRDQDRGPGQRPTVPRLRSRQVRDEQPRHRRRDARRLRPPHRAEALQEGGQARPDPRRRGSPASTEAELLRQIREILPPQTQVRSGVAQAETDASETNASPASCRHSCSRSAGLRSSSAPS